ncbi:citrate synthase [Desulfoluna spongiiphila]|uniref:Citrate synthase n=1 Tax=Desulfoluna spongiiphila TaxID=419481 RepID=A0A1G5AMQ0_9BACT|nr:citrate synthase [Desulfoluna spongiiphila]SCX79115.1 citrate synthase [Desulfoluna spongiiphila]VVS90456.1 citrate synthase type i [Desulfoluna spongiiphila]
MSEVVKMIIEGKTYEFPVVVGSEGEKAFDITKLRQQTGYITMDPGFGNTGSCTSAITFMDGEKGILRYRGIPVEQLAEHSSFVETAYLLINGRLPNRQELTRTSVQLNDDSLIHEDMQIFYQNFPRRAHPMGILSAMLNALRSFYPELEDTDPEGINRTFLRLLSKIRTMAAMSYRISRGHKVVYPRADYSYCANFLNMMFDSPVRPYELDPDIVEALNVFWILHGDHEQNCSTAAVRVVGSGRVNLYAAISAGIAALWGPLHGGANQAVIEMLTNIHQSGADIEDVVKRAKDKDDPFRLMGFGHRVYKTYDPRAKIMKKMCDTVLPKLKVEDPLLDIARRLEEVALTDPYFVDKNLYPNVDFYSGIVLRAMGIPTEMFTVMFAIGRLPGWISQWKEGADDPNWKISRPRQVYTGNTVTDYLPMNQR